MFAASLSHQARPVSVLLGGSGMRRTAAQKKPDVAALLKPRTGCITVAAGGCRCPAVGG